MGDYLISVGSITYALKGKELLNKNGFNAELMKISKQKNAEGCGYSLRVSERTEEAIDLLVKSGVKVLGKVPKEELR